METQCNGDSDKRHSHIAKLDKVAAITNQKAVYMHEDACSLRRYLRVLEEATTIQFTDRQTPDTPWGIGNMIELNMNSIRKCLG